VGEYGAKPKAADKVSDDDPLDGLLDGIG